MKLYNQTVILASTSPAPRRGPETTVFMVDSVGKRRQFLSVILKELVGKGVRVAEEGGDDNAPSAFMGGAWRR